VSNETCQKVQSSVVQASISFAPAPNASVIATCSLTSHVSGLGDRRGPLLPSRSRTEEIQFRGECYISEKERIERLRRERIRQEGRLWKHKDSSMCDVDTPGGGPTPPGIVKQEKVLSVVCH